MSSVRVISGCLLNPLSDTECTVIPHGAIAFEDAPGGDRKVIAMVDTADAVEKHFPRATTEWIDRSDCVILPGFYDMHFHWVQDHVRELSKMSLLDWLNTNTFPAEAKFADVAYSRAEAERFWTRIKATGTVGGLVYSSIHPHATDIALDHAEGDFVVGNVLMTMNSPDFLRQTEADAVDTVRQLAPKHRERYVYSPRFAPTTAPEVMRAGAAIAREHNAFFQTHLAETTQEIDWVLSIYRDLPGFEDVASYTDIYRRTDMLGPQTCMGHGIYLDDAEWTMLAETNTAISHCPTSNAPVEELGLGSGLFSFQEADRRGVRWYLASDIGGGPFLSMFDVMRSFVDQNARAGNAGATYTRALYRSTQACAEFLEIGDRTGNFAVGKEATFVVVPVADGVVSADASADADADGILEAIIATGRSDRNAYDHLPRETWLRGQRIFSGA